MTTAGKLATMAAAALSLLTACDTSGCLDNQSSIPLAGFYSSQDNPQAIALDSLNIGGIGAPADSLLLSAGESASAIYLPLRSTASSTAFVINYAYPSLGIDSEAFNDTIAIGYDSEPYFASEACGAMYRYRVTSLTHTTHLIDSVAVTDSLITNTDVERLRIYFHVSALSDDDTTSSPSL